MVISIHYIYKFRGVEEERERERDRESVPTIRTKSRMATIKISANNSETYLTHCTTKLWTFLALRDNDYQTLGK